MQEETQKIENLVYKTYNEFSENDITGFRHFVINKLDELKETFSHAGENFLNLILEKAEEFEEYEVCEAIIRVKQEIKNYYGFNSGEQSVSNELLESYKKIINSSSKIENDEKPAIVQLYVTISIMIIVYKTGIDVIFTYFKNFE
jgi:hypothetical protein